MRDNNNQSGMLRFRGIAGMIMGLVYIGVGILIIKMKGLGDFNMAESASYIVGIVIALYGLFRIYRGFKTIKSI